MNIDTQSNVTSVNNNPSTSKTQKKSDTKFSDELNKVAKEDSKTKSDEEKNIEADPKNDNDMTNDLIMKSDKENGSDIDTKDNKEISAKSEKDSVDNETAKDNSTMNDVIDGLQQTVEELNKLNQKNENANPELKKNTLSDDKNREDNALIDNNLNIKDKTEQQLPQMNASMNFNSNGQPFSAFVEAENNENNKLSSSAGDLAEEQAILSTMNENMAIAQKNMLLNKNTQEDEVEQFEHVEHVEQVEQAPKTKTVTNEQGIKKVDTKTNVTTETVVKFDDIAMNKNDVDFFANLVENGSVDMNSVQNAQKSSQVSKSLADMIAKSMQDNQPIRINFDNDISVIIKVSKNGKISADFLPSSQIAEAYLKENLPILKQRFDDNNIDYEELNPRKQEQQDDRNNRKKGRKDE